MYNITWGNTTYVFVPYPVESYPIFHETMLHHVATILMYIGVGISTIPGLYNLYSLFKMKMANKKSLYMGSISVFLSAIFLFYSIANNYLPFIITNSCNTFSAILSLGMQYYFYKHPKQPMLVHPMLAKPGTNNTMGPTNGLNETQVGQVLNLIKLFNTLEAQKKLGIDPVVPQQIPIDQGKTEVKESTLNPLFKSNNSRYIELDEEV